MNGLHKSAHPWFLVLILAMLVTRLGGAHLHLCFDGQEPPAAIHMADGAVHNDAHHVDQKHTDQDVEMFDAVPGKIGKGSIDFPFLFAACLLFLVLLRPSGGRWPLAAFYQACAFPPFQLRPPLRGPPL